LKRDQKVEKGVWKADGEREDEMMGNESEYY
jgi:hypothetical protein